MKKIITILLSILFLAQPALSQIQYYGIDIILNVNGKSQTKLTITYLNQEKKFNLIILGKIENFKSLNPNIAVCNASIGGFSFISCDLNLTEKRTFEINFETFDFVKPTQDKFLFVADLTPNKDVSSVFTSVKLPEGMALVKEGMEGKISFPENITIVSDGRHHIITWYLSNITKDKSLKFQFFYEFIQRQPLLQFRIRDIIIFGIVTATALWLIYYNYFRKEKKVLLSVLDEFERNVINVIASHGGTVNQKKVVQETNLSKAKVSRVVKSLAERGLIEVERLGRTNKLKLKKKLGI
ncbi:MAG: MarR family transcriptional regulator [Candidatus Aenigmatarchaeota archaeon]